LILWFGIDSIPFVFVNDCVAAVALLLMRGLKLGIKITF
jgi:hypothetical protein